MMEMDRATNTGDVNAAVEALAQAGVVGDPALLVKGHGSFAPCFDHMDDLSDPEAFLRVADRLEEGETIGKAMDHLSMRQRSTMARHLCSNRPIIGWWSDNYKTAVAEIRVYDWKGATPR